MVGRLIGRGMWKGPSAGVRVNLGVQLQLVEMHLRNAFSRGSLHSPPRSAAQIPKIPPGVP